MLKIKELREEQNLTQKDLGQKLGIAGHNIGDWERNKCEPSIEMLTKIADIFECSIDYLTGREDEFGIINKNIEITEEEKIIINEYRKLLPMYKKIIKQQLEVFNESNIESKTK